MHHPLTEPDAWLAANGFDQSGPGLWHGPDRVVAVVTPHGVFLGWADVEWHGVINPRERLKGITHVTMPADDSALRAALASARRAATRAMRKCRYCENAFAPGAMHDSDVCQGCAERELGVVH